ncbi:MAG TPA: ComEC/Rec2 family competence protein [Bacteroidales bacterium]|nr:ComEC/Rec2 family competence protein [Bacteroidales bacterium]HQP15089.1 ComEC/Rec2 family competence protein [Bacteroidales bacterium]
MFWNKYPIARILLPFLSGICIAIGFELSFAIPVIVFALLAGLISFVVIVFQRKLGFRMRWLTGILFTTFFFLAGYQLTVIKTKQHDITHYSNYLAAENYVLAELCEPVQIREKVCKCVVEIKEVKDSVQSCRTSGKAIIYLEKDSLSSKLKYGDEIFFRGRFTEVSPPMNPGEYNYKNYLKYRQVEYSTYVMKARWKLIASGNGSILKGFAYNLREKLLQILRDNGLQGQEFAVVSALLVGYTDNLDPELIREYQGTGAVHILSVSGLHVGIIFIVLNFLLQFFDKTRYGRLLKALLLLVFIWFYAVLTGMSPSVMRATAMFSFVVVGKALRQPPAIYNTIAASALVLLMFDPYMFMAVGFQLSYLAVLGIVALYPAISKVWIPKYWLLRQIWSLVAVSLAAQLVTFPLCLLYFHQFPNYFLLTNIIATPLSGLVIYLGIAVLVFSFIPWLAMMLAKALSYSLIFLNGSVSFIEGLPFSVTRSISVTFVEMLLVYAIILSLCVFIMRRNNKAFIGAAAFLLLLVFSVTVRNFNALSQQAIIVYNINKHTAIDLIEGKTAFFICDSAVMSDVKKQEFHLMNNRCRMMIEEVIPLPVGDGDITKKKENLFARKNLYCFAGKTLGIVDRATYNTKKMKLDYMVVANNPDLIMEEMLNQYAPVFIIFDASNSAKNVAGWSNQCEMLGKSYYSTKNSGAWQCFMNNR